MTSIRATVFSMIAAVLLLLSMSTPAAQVPVASMPTLEICQDSTPHHVQTMDHMQANCFSNCALSSGLIMAIAVTPFSPQESQRFAVFKPSLFSRAIDPHLRPPIVN